MQKKSFLLYYDSYPWVRQLGDEEKGRLLEALFLYGLTLGHGDLLPKDFLDKTELPVSKETRLVFGFMADSMYRDNLKWKRTQRAKLAKKEERDMPLNPEPEGRQAK